MTNLLQQQTSLEFIEIKEATATYYLAPLRISGEDNVHIELWVSAEEDQEPMYVKFTQKLYSDK